MTPKKPKHFIKPTAEALGLSESLVDDIASFYWSNVRKELSELESPSVTVTNLCIFQVRYKKIDTLKKKYFNYLNGLTPENMTFNKHTIQNLSKEKLKKLDEIRDKMQEEFQRQKEVKVKRKEYVINKTVERKRENS